MRQLRVFRYLKFGIRDTAGFWHSGAFETLVACPSVAAAARALDITRYEATTWLEEANDVDAKIALTEPGAVFYHPQDQQPIKWQKMYDPRSLATEL
jgi:hypothetical protein